MLSRIMMEHSQKIYLLADHSKLNLHAERRLCDFSAVDYLISDIDFPESTVKKFPKTNFIFVPSEDKK